MATRCVWSPLTAEFPASNFPQLTLINRRPVLAYDAATKETAYFSFVAPQGVTGTLTLVVTYMMASATSNLVDFEAQVEAVSDGDATDLDAGDSFDTANTQSGVTVPGTAGYIDQVSITLTNSDSLAAGDYVRIALARDAADGTNDTATGDAYVLQVEFRDGA
jgi:hypothetical protein